MAQSTAGTDITQAMQKVRQIRQFLPDEVPEETIEELLQVARWTGSSRNTQPWHFVAVTDKDELQQVSQVRPAINWVADAPLGIAIVLDGEAEVSEAYDEGRVTERLMIAAHVLGYGAGVAWFGDNDQQVQAKQTLGIPSNRMARSIVAIGKPITSVDPRPNPAEGGRRSMDEVTSRNRMS